VVDRTAPSSPVFTSPAPGSFVGSSAPQLSGTAEPGARVSVAMDGTALGAATADAQGRWAVSAAALGDGPHTAVADATDAAGNTGAPSAATFTVDTLAPDTSMTGPQALIASRSASFAFASGEAGATFECRILPAAFAPCAAALSMAGLADGQYTMEVRAVDAAGNRDPTPAAWTWTVDATPPRTSITSAPAARTVDTTAHLSFAADEPSVTYEYQLDGAAWTGCSGSVDLPALALGEHRLKVRARDAAGNVDPAPPEVVWLVAPHQYAFAGGGCSTTKSPAWPALVVLALAAAWMRRRRRAA
jgi:uncharacterized protein (TIGR03382 family)